MGNTAQTSLFLPVLAGLCSCYMGSLFDSYQAEQCRHQLKNITWPLTHYTVSNYNQRPMSHLFHLDQDDIVSRVVLTKLKQQ